MILCISKLTRLGGFIRICGFICILVLFLTNILLAPVRFDTPALAKLDPNLLPFFNYSLDKAAYRLSAKQESLIDAEGLLPVIIETESPAHDLEKLGVHISSQVGRIITCSIPIIALPEALQSPEVKYIHNVSTHYPMLDEVVNSIRLNQKPQTIPPLTGSGVILGIYDTGIDWQHDDFRKEDGSTRILFLWDQTSSTGPAPTGYSYGREYTRVQINNELSGVTSGAIKQKDVNGHGTHVASIAGGDGSATGNGKPSGRYVGIAPEADFIIVKGGDSTFSTNREIDGMNYIAEKAKALGKPVVINLSLGGQKGAHDGTEPSEKAIDEIIEEYAPGTAVIVAAGNAGKEKIHFAHTFSSKENVYEAFIDVPTYTANPGSDNDNIEIEAWYSGTSPPSVTVYSPNGQTSGVVYSRRWDEKTGTYGQITIDNSFNGENPFNGDYEINISISDFKPNPKTEVSPSPGTWKIEFRTTSGKLDGWLHDSSMKAQLADESAVYEKLVAIPGTAREAITVGSYKSKHSWETLDGERHSDNTEIGDISPFSSPGPSRDGRQKPEITAPGQEITGALSRDYDVNPGSANPDGVHITFRGTSMSTPVITGLVALMLQNNPNMTATEIKEILQTYAKKDDYTGNVWNAIWGFGKVDAKTTLEQVTGISEPPESAVPTAFELHQNYPNPFNTGTMIRYTLPLDTEVFIVIYGIDGREIAVLENTFQTAGEYRVYWDGKNRGGMPVASNIYLARLSTKRYTKTIKMVLLK